MNKITRNLVVALFIFSAHFLTLHAQGNNPKIATEIKNLIEKSNNYQNYKIIEKGALNNFEKNLDTYITQQKNTQSSLKSQITIHEATISGLQANIKEVIAKNKVLSEEKSSINFLGFLVDKANYSMIMWSLLIVLLVIIAILFYRFKNANTTTKHTQSVLQDLENNYDLYRRASIEKEQGLRRQLFEEEKKNSALKKSL